MVVFEQISRSLALFRKNWKLFLAIHLVANGIYLLVLGPLFTLLSGWLVLLSGEAALTDQDILLFAFTPRGMAAMVVLAALFMTLLVFEYAAMILAGYQLRSGGSVDIRRLLTFIGVRASVLFRFAVRMVLLTTALASPFLLAIAAIVWAFLSKFDINFYLATQPPVFWWAGGAIILILLLMLWVLLRVFAGWIIALPLLLISQDNPAQAYRHSRELSAHLRAPVGITLLGFALLNTVLFAIVGWLLDFGTRGAVLLAGESLTVLAYLVGGLFICWSLANLAVSFFSNSLLSLGIVDLFLRLVPATPAPMSNQQRESALTRKKFRISGYLVAVLLMVGVLGAGFVLNRAMDAVQLPGHTSIIAHRGASIDAPENTLAAMEEAIRQGTDWLEIDVQETAAGEIVVIHDRDLMKVSQLPLRIRDASLSQLLEIDIGSWFDPQFSDERVPGLRELLSQVKGRVKVNIELKYYGQEQQLEQRVIDIVEELDMMDQTVAMSLNLEGVRKLKQLRPEWSVGLLSTVAMGDLSRLNVDFFAINGRFATRSFISRAQSRGLEVNVWTINNPLDMAAMMNKGVDGIITDLPGLALEVREQRLELDGYQRLMIHLASFLGGSPGPEQ